MYTKWATALVALAGSILQISAQIPLTITSDASVKAAAKIAAANMMTYYTGNQPGQTPGMLPGPYYWWEAGAMFGQLINYWQLTGDTQYNDIITQAMLWQIGDKNNYMPDNETKSLGNDDQAFWAFSALDAAESKFPDPPNTYPSWVALAQAVWNTQYPRWDTTKCGGGLRWQIFYFNPGYEYKNAISNGGFFQLCARLYRYTGNQTYADWAEKSWNWIYNSPLMDQSLNQVWDGTAMANNCSDNTKVYWTYNAGTMLVGSAYMYNATSDPVWLDRVQGLLNATNIFFVKGGQTDPSIAQPLLGGTIMSEIACESQKTCNYDQPSFKAYLSRWMAVSGQLVPQIAAQVYTRLSQSAAAAAPGCTGAAMGKTNMCGRRWYQTIWDGNYGVGEQMSALSVFQNLLIKNVPAPYTLKNGGTSKSDPEAGFGSGQGSGLYDPYANMPITTGDRAGAGILTLISMVLIAGGAAWTVL